MIFGARQLLLGDPRERQEARYRLAMKVRRIDVSGVTLEQLGLSEERSKPHSNSGGPELEAVLRELPVRPGDAVIDLGCGKGGAMLTLAKYPFARVDGVEISPALCQTAEVNLKRAGVKNASVYCCDAGEFGGLDSYTYVYMYNPFPESVIQKVSANLQLSLERSPRNLVLVYKNPLYEHSITNAGFRRIMQFNQFRLPVRIYAFGRVA